MTDKPIRDSVIDTQISIGGQSYLRMIIKYLSGTREVADYAVVVVDGVGNPMGLKIVGWHRGCPVVGLVSYAMWLVTLVYDNARDQTDIQPPDDSDKLFGGRLPDHVPYHEAGAAAMPAWLEDDLCEQILASLEPVTV